MFDEFNEELIVQSWYASLPLEERRAHDRRMEEARKEANTVHLHCVLIPGHGFTVTRIDPSSPSPSEHFRFGLHIVRYIIDTACIKVAGVWLFSFGAHALFKNILVTALPLVVYFLFSYIRHQLAREPPPRYLNIL